MQNPCEVIVAGVFGDRINNRSDFHKELDEVKTYVERVIQRLPHERLLSSVHKQLEALQAWTIGGRTPTPDERKSIIMGIQIYREYEMTDDDDLDRLKGRVGSLNNYVKHWPDDKVATDPNNGIYL
jgi:hypothetical protein